MSDSEQQEPVVSKTRWPEFGGAWSDGDEGADMDECGLLQEMAEEDEEIDFYNEETFGMDLDAVDLGEDPASEPLQFEGSISPPSPAVTPASPPSPPKCPSPPSRRPQSHTARPQGLRVNGRGGQRRTPMSESPPVRQTWDRSSLKDIYSSVADYEIGSPWNTVNRDTHLKFPSYRKTRRTSDSILQDNAIVCVIDSRGHYTRPNFLDSAYPFYSSRGRRFPSRGPYSCQPFDQRSPMQMEGFLSPQTPPSTAQSLTPKMMQLRFGVNSPTPYPVYSPSANPVQRFKYISPVTQLHPQHKRLLSQRQHPSHRKVERSDPYCHLMLPKEREWITRMLMMPLQSESPHMDYYYQEYYRQKESKPAVEFVIRRKREPPRLITPHVTKTDPYTPVVHIEGSLGQVAVSTCYSPRRAIGAVHAAQAKCPHEIDQKDTRQQRLEVLMIIEECFLELLEVEEMERTKDSVLTEAEMQRLLKKSQRKVEHIYAQLQYPDLLGSGEEFLPVLQIPKGKKLLARLLPFLASDHAVNTLQVVTTHLPVLMSKDTDEALPVLYPSLAAVIGRLNFSQLVQALKDLTALEPDSKDSKCLVLACQNKFGLSLLYALLSQGEKLLCSDHPLEPGVGDFETWTNTIFQVAWQLSQSSLAEPLVFPPNLLKLFCRYLDKRTVYQLKSNMESATGSLALPS